MLATIRIKAQNFFTKGHERTIKVKKNIAISFLLKCISISIGFVLIPMTINYVNTTNYGIWLTLSSVITWFSFFDIGLGNGLKNRLAEANALGDKESAKTYISTTYAILAIISSLIFIIFYFVNKYIDWGQILNTTESNGLNKLMLIVFGFFCLQLILQLINTVLTALHVPSKVSLIEVISQFSCLIALSFIAHKTSGSLIILVLIVAGIPLIIQFIASLWIFKGIYKNISPSFKYVKFGHVNKLLSVGSIFFIIQIGALILFQTDNIIITQIFGPKEVTTFNIAYKLFSIITIGFTILMTPMWSAFTDAYTKKDYVWIRKSLNRMKTYWVGFVFMTGILFAISPIIYKFWLQDKVQVPLSLSLAFAIYVVVYSWQTIHVFLLNGIGKIRLQLYLVLISAALNIPLAIYLGKWIGLAGITLSNAIIFLVMSIFYSIQCNKLLNNRATKIWNS